MASQLTKINGMDYEKLIAKVLGNPEFVGLVSIANSLFNGTPDLSHQISQPDIDAVPAWTGRFTAANTSDLAYVIGVLNGIFADSTKMDAINALRKVAD